MCIKPKVIGKWVANSYLSAGQGGAKVTRTPIPSLTLLSFEPRRIEVELEIFFLDFARGEDLSGFEFELLFLLLSLLRPFLNLLLHRVPPVLWHRDPGDRYASAFRRSRSTRTNRSSRY